MLIAVDADAIAGLWFADGRGVPALAADPDPDAGPPVVREAPAQLAAYFAGRARAFDLPLRPAGGDFARRVCDALATVPWGATIGYAALAGPARRRATPGRRAARTRATRSRS